MNALEDLPRRFFASEILMLVQGESYEWICRRAQEIDFQLTKSKQG